MLGGRLETAIGRPRPDAFELAGLAALGAAAVALAAGAVTRPSLTLVAIPAFAAVLVLLLRTDFALLLVVATAPLEGLFASGPGGASVTKIAGGICIASFALSVLRERRVLVFERGQALVLGILALALLSSLQAHDTGAALTTATRYASFAAVYVIFTQYGHDRLFQRRIAWTLALTCSIAAAAGLYEYQSGKESLATLPYSQSNDFAFILATSLPLMFFLLDNRRWRLLVAGMIGLVSAATLLSLSRGALLGLGAGFVLFVLTDRRRVKLTLVAGLAATIGTLVVIHLNPQRFHEALFLKQQVAQQNVTTRFEAWGAAARLATDHPFLGVGPGNFGLYYNKLTGEPVGVLTLTVAHNALLDVGAELGLAAMILLALYLLLAFVRLTSSLYEGYGDPGFVRALRISLTIAIVSAMFLSEQYFLPFWLIGGLAAAIWVHGRNSAAPAE